MSVDSATNVMNLKSYELARIYLHANDNMEKKDDTSRLLKVELVVYTLRTSFLSVDQE